MKRRNFLKIAAGAAALALSPVLLNTTRLRLAEPIKGVHRFFPGEVGGNITEVGIAGSNAVFDNGSKRIVLDQPITVLDDEYLDVWYTYYADGREPKISLRIGKE